MRPLTVLMTDIQLTMWSGAKIVLRDFALKLGERGHRVVAWSSQQDAEVVSELRRIGVDVLDDMSDLPYPPDVIQGQHNIPTMIAMATYPGVPAVLFCHSREWADVPLHLARIWRYIAVDRMRHEFLVKRHGVDPARVVTLHNAVDLTRYPPRHAPLPARPANALAFTKRRGHVALLRSICESRGMAFEALGTGADKVVVKPEEILSRQDLVFATGRSAIESACAGAAVILADARGIAGMVTRRNFRALRKANFGSLALIHRMNPANVIREIERYDPEDAAEVTRLVRQDADLDSATDRMESLLQAAAAAGFPNAWTDDDRRGLTAFLDNWPAPPGWEAERARLAALLRANG